MSPRRRPRSRAVLLVRLLAAGAVLAAVLAHPGVATAASDVCYKGGPTLANFKLNGDAFLDGSSIVITPDVGNKAGSAMYQNKFSTASDFHIKLVLKIATTSSIQPADGMAFVMHNDARATSVVGGLGDGVGYQGILNSVVVEFDTYQNLWDPVNPHIAITRLGQANHNHASNSGLPVVQFSSLTPPIDPVNGNPVHIWIDYTATTDQLQVFVATSDSKPAAAALSAVLDLAVDLGADFYVGFTGSTGSRWDKHEFLELYATDNAATAKASCCDADADCVGSPHGGVCDTEKHVCGQCRFASTATCAVGNTGCGLSSSHNVCQTPCNGNFGSVATNPCTSAAYPACRTSGVGVGSCGVCNGDFESAASASCATGAPFCGSSGYCGRCTTNSQCTEGGVTHTGVVCNTTSGRCVGACTLDSQCGAGNACAAGFCAAKAANGEAIPGGTCDVARGTRYCISGACSSANVCIPAASGSCFVDGDCAAGSYCKRMTFACLPKLPPGTAIPSDGLHDGTCAAAAAVCTDGLCNPATVTCGAALGAACTGASGCAANVCGSNGKCGIADTNGPCTVGTGPAVCQSGVCGDSAGLCLPPGPGSCDADGDCAGLQYCDAVILKCAAKLAAGEPLPSDLLHDGRCAPALAALACADGACNATTDTCAQVVGSACGDAADCVADVCSTAGTCGYVNGLGPCSGASAATVCQSGTCSVASICMPAASGSCYVDADCGAAEHCRRSTFTCVAKLAPGAAIPDDGLHGGACLPSVAAAVCESGACNATTSTCAAANGTVCTAANQCVVNRCGSNGNCGAASGDAGCTPGNAATFCQSGTCGSSGVCIPPAAGSCYVDGDCGAGFFCRRDTFTCTARLAAGAALPDDGLHGSDCAGGVGAAVCSTGVCNAATDTCALPLGSPCAIAAECQVNACAANGKCGHLEGTGTCTGASAATDCQSGACSTAGVCIRPAGCWVDADCASGSFCNRATQTCAIQLAAGVPIPDDGLHGGTCDAADDVCVTGLCNATTRTCASGLGADCTDDSACLENSCGSNGKCGIAAGDGPCTLQNAAAVCQSGVCGGASGRCVPAGAGGCGLDSDCSAGQFCNAVTLTCQAQLAAGAPLPSNRLHAGRCSGALAAAVCADGSCNPATDTCARGVTAACQSAADCVANVCNSGGTCGYQPGTGSCTLENAPTICASGRCSASAGVCLGTPADSCWVDGDCAQGDRCDRAAGACRPKLAPGSPIPDDGLHDGTCTPDNAGAVCESGACNRTTHTCGSPPGDGCTAAAECSNGVCGSNDRCGHPPGQGACTPANAATVCQSGICGAVSGVCSSAGAGGCGADADCPTERYCHAQTRRCETRLAPGAALPEDGEHADCVEGRSSACAGGLCNADRRTCASANDADCTEDAQCAVNVCGRDGTCGLADGQPGCTSTTAVLCQSGVCAASGVCGSAGCLQDGDCPGTAFCDGDTGLCKVKLAPGQRLPQDPLHNGICTPALGLALCATGVCNPHTSSCAIPKGAPCSIGADCAIGTCGSNGKCGLAPGEPGCTAATAAALCQSGLCSSSGRCKPAGVGGCAVDADCAADTYCNGATLTCAAKLIPGAPIPRDGLHNDGCLPENAAALCASGACNARAGTCAAIPGQACQSDAECVGNVCGSNGLCGAADGAGPCDAGNQATVCQSGVCNVAAKLCQPAGEGRCVRDADCSAGRFCARETFTCETTLTAGAPLPTDPIHPGTCDRGVAEALCASGLCNAAAATCATGNDTECAEAKDCASNVCHDGRCGLPDSEACGSGTECRTGRCTGGACGTIPLEDIPIRASGGGGCHLGPASRGQGGGLSLAIAALLLAGLVARRRRR